MKKILIIEDDKVMRENTAEILELAHYLVKTAENGKKGVTLAKEWGPDLIICDIMMPEIDGYGVLHILSKTPETFGVPFIFLTAKAEKSEMRKGMNLGADDYLTKPFEDTELLSSIETRLKKNELLKKEFSKNGETLNKFLNEIDSLTSLKGLYKKNQPVFYKKKQILFHEGDIPQNLFFLNQGKIKAYKTHEDGKEYITNIYNTGDFFGYTTLLENKTYEDSASCMEDTYLTRISKNDFFSLLHENRDVAGAFIKILSDHVAEKEKQLISMAYDSVRKRTANTLLKLAKPLQNKEKTITISRDDMAAMVGTATETLIRNLAEFKDEKWIKINGRQITILDTASLQEVR